MEAPHSVFLPALKAAARSMGMDLVDAHVRSDAEVESMIAALGREPTTGLFAMPDSFTFVRRALVTAQVAKHRVPAIYPFRGFAASGSLVSFGIDVADQYRGAVSYVDRILRPADLPVQQPTKFEFVINIKTAKVLGLTVPPSLLAGADEVIEELPSVNARYCECVGRSL